MDQPLLFQARQTWLHYIGGYYKTADAFVSEAQRIGISRRVAALAARGIQFGDRVILLRWNEGRPHAFAEMQITGLVLDHEIAARVGRELEAQGKAEYFEGGGSIQRACGSYISLGTWCVDAELSEIIDIALQIAEQEKPAGQEKAALFVMLGGRLTEVYPNPVSLTPSPKFTRGFIRANEETIFENQVEPAKGQVMAISDYSKAEKYRTPKRKQKLRRSPTGNPALLSTVQ